MSWDALAHWLAPRLGLADDPEVESSDELAAAGYSAQTIVITGTPNGRTPEIGLFS